MNIDRYIPKRYIDADFSNYKASTREQAETLKAIKDYADTDTDRNLILSGNIGTGKTMLAVAYLKHKAETSESVHNVIRYVTISELIMISRQSMSYGGNNDMKKFYTTKYLVIDEIGRQSGSDNELNILFEILNKRYNEMLPTVLVTNKKKNELHKYLGDAIIDRLIETKSLFIDFTWQSFRSKQRKEF